MRRVGFVREQEGLGSASSRSSYPFLYSLVFLKKKKESGTSLEFLSLHFTPFFFFYWKRKGWVGSCNELPICFNRHVEVFSGYGLDCEMILGCSSSSSSSWVWWVRQESSRSLPDSSGCPMPCHASPPRGFPFMAPAFLFRFPSCFHLLPYISIDLTIHLYIYSMCFLIKLMFLTLKYVYDIQDLLIFQKKYF